MRKKKKVTFAVIFTIILLAMACLTVWYLAERDRQARLLYQATDELVKQIQEYSFEDIKSCQKLVDECNMAISEKNLQNSKLLLIQVTEKKTELEELYQKIKEAKAKQEKYISLSGQDFITDFPSTEYAYQMSVLESGINSKDGKQIDSAVKILDDITLRTNNQLREEAEYRGNRFLSVEITEGNEEEKALIKTWQSETRQALNAEDYVKVCQITAKGEQLANIFAEKKWMDIEATGLNVELEQEGKIFVRIPETLPALEDWMNLEDCILIEKLEDSTEYELCRVISVQKEDPKPFVGANFLLYGASIYGNNGYYMDFLLPREHVKSLQNWDLDVDDITSINNGLGTDGFYDMLYKMLKRAVQQDAQNFVVVSLAEAMGVSAHTQKDIIELAKSNDIPVYILGEEINNELNQLAEETGGRHLKMGLYELEDSVLISLLDSAYQKQERVYSIRYQTGASGEKDRKITLDYPGKYNLRCEYHYKPSFQQAKTADINIQTADQFPISQDNQVTDYLEEDYLISDSNSRYLMEEDISMLDTSQLRLARNEIYARHGRKFTNPEIQNYFMQKSWYHPSIEPEAFKDEMLNIYEKANAEFMSEYESKIKSHEDQGG